MPDVSQILFDPTQAPGYSQLVNASQQATAEDASWVQANLDNPYPAGTPYQMSLLQDARDQAVSQGKAAVMSGTLTAAQLATSIADGNYGALGGGSGQPAADPNSPYTGATYQNGKEVPATGSNNSSLPFSQGGSANEAGVSNFGLGATPATGTVQSDFSTALQNELTNPGLPASAIDALVNQGNDALTKNQDQATAALKASAVTSGFGESGALQQGLGALDTQYAGLKAQQAGSVRTTAAEQAQQAELSALNIANQSINSQNNLLNGIQVPNVAGAGIPTSAVQSGGAFGGGANTGPGPGSLQTQSVAGGTQGGLTGFIGDGMSAANAPVTSQSTGASSDGSGVSTTVMPPPAPPPSATAGGNQPGQLMQDADGAWHSINSLGAMGPVVPTPSTPPTSYQTTTGESVGDTGGYMAPEKANLAGWLKPAPAGKVAAGNQPPAARRPQQRGLGATPQPQPFTPV